VIPLHEGRVYHHADSHHFCYTNTRRPQWHDVWTRTQVRGWRLLASGCARLPGSCGQAPAHLPPLRRSASTAAG